MADRPPDDSPELHRQRLAWLDSLIAGFEAIGPDDHARPVPACPGWDVRNVLAHIAYGALLFWVVPSTHPRLADVPFGRLSAVAGDGRGVELLPGALRALSLVLHSHRPDDPTAAVVGEQRFASLAGLVTTELAVHLLDCQEALGRPRSLPEDHAASALAWTVAVWLPIFASLEGAAAPPGRVALVAGPEHHLLGAGEDVAEVRGRAVDVLLALWGRSAPGAVTGRADVVAHWTGLTARTTAVAARA
jgi:uncharacterized protein (TIGR03083 family)